MKRVSLFIFIIISLSACVTGNDFEMLRNDVNDLKRSSYDSKKEVDILKERTASIVKEDSFSAVQEGQATINSRLSELTSNHQELRGRFEENKYFFEKTLKDSISEKDLLKAQITALETQVKTMKDKLALVEEQIRKTDQAKQPEAVPAASGQPEKTEQPTETKPQEQPSEKKELPDTKSKNSYEEALDSFHSKQYKQAREKFEAFLKNNPKTDLIDNAYFWIAESYYAEKDYEGAILAYETLLKKYPQSEKTTEALRKQGFAFIEIGDKKTGKIILEKLIEKHPNSKDAELAKKKLSEIDTKKPAKKK